MSTRRTLVFFAAAAAAVGLALALAIVEIMLRAIDGYGFRVRLAEPPTPKGLPPSGRSGKWMAPVDAEYYVRQFPTATGVNRAWYALDPQARPQRPFDLELAERYRAHEGFELASVYEWNQAYVRRALCNEQRLQMAVFSSVDDLFMYELPDGDIYPQFRFLQNVRYMSGLQTNTFGWRGTDIPLVKPAGTVRIAFVGASTTIDPHVNPYSYPEYIGEWLNEWARASSRPVRFEIINAGREGIDIKGAAGVVEHELVPVQPDLVVDYEGVNQFWPDAFVRGKLPPRPRTLAELPSRLEGYSALARRTRTILNRLQSGREPSKPALLVDWPADLDEQDPPLDDPRLPVTLPTIIASMDRMRAQLARYGGTYVSLSFVWMVQPDLVLDRQRDAGIYTFLNVTLWPFSYAHIRRYADFQNRAFRKYAATHDLPFVDLAAVYPRDPRLFLDAIHMSPAGIKLKAWLVFQQLLPEVERRLADGRLPVPDAGGRMTHPAFSTGPPRLVRLESIRQSCTPLRESQIR